MRMRLLMLAMQFYSANVLKSEIFLSMVIFLILYRYETFCLLVILLTISFLYL